MAELKDFIPCEEVFDYLDLCSNNICARLDEVEKYFPDYFSTYLEKRIYPDDQKFAALMNSHALAKHIKNSGFLTSIMAELHSNGANYEQLIYDLNNGFMMYDVDYFNTEQLEVDSKIDRAALSNYLEKVLKLRGWFTPDGINYYKNEELYEETCKVYGIDPNEE